MSWRRLRTLIVREIRATLRDPFTLFVLVFVPLGSLLAFGFVVSTEIEGIRLGVFDGARSELSRRIVAELTAHKAFEAVPFARRDELSAALVNGEIGAGIVFPADFERARSRSAAGDGSAQIQLLYDGAESVLAANAEGFLRGITGAVLRESGGGDPAAARADAMIAATPIAAPAGAGAGAGIRSSVRVLFNPTLDGRPYMVAGTFGFVLSFLTTLITAVSIVNERIGGTFEQLQLTPATSLEIVLGKLLPLGAVFSFDVFLMMTAAWWILDTWPAGSALLFWSIASFYVITSLALGLIFSATSATAAEAVQKTVLFSIPLVQLSGFLYPIRSMPEPVQWVTHLIPATHFINISRAIYLRGEGIGQIWGELLIIAGFGIALVVLARRTVESRA